MTDAEWLLHEHLPADHSLAKRTRDQLFPDLEIVSVPRIASGMVGQCYENTRNFVKMHGGSIQCGWVLTIWPGQFVEALHHAVWRGQSGELKDVTDRSFPRVEGSVITFLPDNLEVDALHDPKIKSRFYPISNNPRVVLFARLSITLVDLRDKCYAYATAIDGTFLRNSEGERVWDFSGLNDGQKKHINSLAERANQLEILKNSVGHELFQETSM